MKSIECYIIQDLLPLYIDHACSEQTAEDIKKHLQSCEKCKKLYEEMSSDICVNLHTPEFNSQTLFYHAKKSVLGIILALAMVISCFAINAGGGKSKPIKPCYHCSICYLLECFLHNITKV